MMKKWSKGQNGTLSLRLLSPLASRKTVSETVNAAYIKKTLAGSLMIFKPNRPGLLFQDRFLSWVNSQSLHCHLCPRVPGVERLHDDLPPTLFIGYYPSGLFFLSKSEVRGGWPLNCPRTASRWAGRGHADQRRRRVRHRILAVVWVLLGAAYKCIWIRMTTFRKVAK